ncbi:inositol 1,4,5-triphosphate receptor associated 1 isoform X2 [Pygocentrus nattereri]|uniref:inositol 1,4,5-triphosphate receptor associated 1 isoform X2 n=1 Tax=Pygocentrus nattereri TaxID=42514 RepID=UPI0018910811|nr:inositol 1,4,5-triphosphate receptor associated 1 isoform X2 [Pygocentrus nattereri]
MFSHRFMASGGRVNVGFFHLICASPHTDCMCNHKDLLNFSADQKMSSQACEDHNVGRALVSEDDSEEGSRQDDSLAWNELSIMERLGPNSVDMTEEDLENAFSQLALAFRCDQYTLDQRLQAEEHARNNAEENLMLEVERGQDLLEALKGMCLDIKRAKVIQSLELCLNIIRGTIERIANTAEVLGAVHQEAKVSRAVELMVAHVENLRRRHERDSVELEEIKKQMQKSSRARQASEIWEEVESGQPEKDSHQHALRRRISAAVILKGDQKTQRGAESHPLSSEEVASTSSSSQVQITDLTGSSEANPNQKNCQLEDGRRLECAEDGSSAMCHACTHPSSPQYFLPEHQQEYDNVQILHRPLSMLPRPRLKSKSSLEMNSLWVRGPKHSVSVCNTFTTGLLHPLMHWMCHCRWIITVIYLIVLCSIIILAILFWLLRAPVLWL